jgi:3-oxoacyl-[acyl-carrier protein] reductase
VSLDSIHVLRCENLMNFGIEGRTALVLGAGGGLGSAIATSLAGEGASVVLADISTEAVERLNADLRGRGLRSCPLHWDLSKIDAIAANLARVQRDIGPVDILVNNTGGPPPASTTTATLDQWQQQFQNMVLSIIAVTNGVLPAMRTRGWGRIITSASSGVVAPIPNLALSNALRSSLLGWSKTLAREVAADGITVNVMIPGRIATARVESLDKAKATRESRAHADIVKESEAAIPVGRYGRPQEYGDVAAFLASSNASYITGALIRVDGGLIASI